MTNSFFMSIKNFYITSFIIIFFILLIILPTLITIYPEYLNFQNFVWPSNATTYITSPYGSRRSPTTGASSFHSGIDIGAPEGSQLIAVCDGTITYTGFLRWWWIYYNAYKWRI